MKYELLRCGHARYLLVKLNVFTRPAQPNIVAGQKTNRNTRPISKEEVELLIEFRLRFV